MVEEKSYTAFKGAKQIAQGSLEQIGKILRPMLSDGHVPGVLVFDDITGQQVDVDLRSETSAPPFDGQVGEPASVERGAEPGRAGRPKLGVVSREVTLLPRHWEWLNSQSGGASVALRKLVDEARKTSSNRDVILASQDSAYKFMSAIAGNIDGYEEAIRALFAKDRLQFELHTQSWPVDIRRHALKLAGAALQSN